MKHIKDYYNSNKELLEEADKLIDDIYKLVGDGASHFSLQISGVKEKRRNEVNKIVNRAKILKDIVKSIIS